jgi:hypothetical protein
VDEWAEDETAQGAAALEARAVAVVEASDMKPETVRHWQTDFLLAARARTLTFHPPQREP